MPYFDNASTTHPKPPEVIEAMRRFMTDCGVSPGRGEYRAAAQCTRLVEDVREAITAHIGARQPERTVFTASCTDALNLAIHGVIQPGDHVVTTMLEHNSVMRPLETLRAAGTISLTCVPFDAEGCVDPAEVAAALKTNTRLVVLNHASNVTGVIQPAAEIGAIARNAGAYFLLDAAQTIGLVEIDVAAMSVDLLAMPAHKELLGPPGLGMLWVDPRVEIRAVRQGGTGADSASALQPVEWPYFLEAGTPNSVAIAGLRAALAYLEPTATLARLRKLLDLLAARLEKIPGVTLLATRNNARRVNTLAITVDGYTASEVAAILDESFDVAVRAGLHCAPNAHRQLGTFPEGAVRLSPGPFTSEDEIDLLADALVEIVAA